MEGRIRIIMAMEREAQALGIPCETIGIGYHSASWLDSVFWTTGHSLQEYLDNPLDFEKTTCSPVSISADALTLNRRNHYDQFKHRILC